MKEVEPLIEAGDLPPIGFFGSRCLGMDGGDGRLEGIGPRRAATQSFIDEVAALFDFIKVPERAILIGKEQELTVSIDSRLAPCVLKEHQGEKTTHFGGTRSDERVQGPGEMDCL